MKKKQLHTKSGFTLIEAVLAVAVMALMLVPLFVLQSSKMQRSVSLSRMFDRLMQAQLFFVQASSKAPAQAHQFTLEKKVTKPETVLRFERKNLPDESPLKKFEGLFLEQVTFEWNQGKSKKVDAIVQYRYKPNTQEDQK